MSNKINSIHQPSFFLGKPVDDTKTVEIDITSRKNLNAIVIL